MLRKILANETKVKFELTREPEDQRQGVRAQTLKKELIPSGQANIIISSLSMGNKSHELPEMPV